MNRQRGFTTLTLIIAALSFVGASAMLWSFWSNFTDGYREEGRVDVRDKYTIIAECDRRKLAPAACLGVWLASDQDRVTADKNFARCEAVSKQQSDAVEESKRAADEAKKGGDSKVAEIERRYAAQRARDAARMQQQAAAPAANPQEACNEAARTLRDLRDRRLRYFSGSDTDSGGNNGNAESGSPEAVLIRP